MGLLSRNNIGMQRRVRERDADGPVATKATDIVKDGNRIENLAWR